MFTEMTVSSILAAIMMMFGDLFAVMAVGLAAFVTIARFVGMPKYRLANQITGAILLTLLCAAGLVARIVSGETAVPNGFIFGFNNWVIALLVVMAVTLLIAFFTLPRLLHL
jgi:hypothetical protein